MCEFYTPGRVGQNHIYTVFIRYFWQGSHQIYGHIRCVYTVLANPKASLSITSAYWFSPRLRYRSYMVSRESTWYLQEAMYASMIYYTLSCARVCVPNY